MERLQQKYYPTGNLLDAANGYAYAVSNLLRIILKQCGDDLTRASRSSRCAWRASKARHGNCSVTLFRTKALATKTLAIQSPTTVVSNQAAEKLAAPFLRYASGYRKSGHAGCFNYGSQSFGIAMVLRIIAGAAMPAKTDRTRSAEDLRSLRRQVQGRSDAGRLAHSELRRRRTSHS